MYADDEAAICTQTRPGLVALANDTYWFYSKFGIQIHKDGTKSWILLVPGNGQNYDDFDTSDIPIQDDPDNGYFGFLKQNKAACIKKTDKYTLDHIGIRFDTTHGFGVDRDNKLGRAKKEWNRGKILLEDTALWDGIDQQAQVQEKMKWYKELVIPKLIQGSEIWPKNLLPKIINFHNECIKTICGHTDQSMEANHLTQEDLQQYCGDKDMESYLHIRLLQWVGRTVQKQNLGIHALKGSLPDLQIVNNKPTATDIRIQEALQCMATKAREYQAPIHLCWPTQSIEGAQWHRTQHTAEQIAKQLEHGHKKVHIETDKLAEKVVKCIHCKQPVKGHIQQRGTPQAYSGIHHHFTTCNGFAKYCSNEDQIRELAKRGHVSYQPTNEIPVLMRNAPRASPTFTTEKIILQTDAQSQQLRDAAQQRDTATNCQDMHQNNAQEESWMKLAEVKSIWKKLLKQLFT